MKLKRDRLSIAVIGAGYWGTKLCREYLEIEKLVGDVSLKYVVDVSPAALEAIAKELGRCHAEFINHYERALHDKELDAVHIAVPNELHYTVAKRALESGKHVLLEKPIATSSRQAFKLAQLADAKGLVLQVGHIFRFNNAVRTLRDATREGRIGKLFYADLEWTTHTPPPKGRNVVFDLAPHPIDILNYILDEWPISADAIGRSFLRRTQGQEEMASINLEFPDGFLAHIYLSYIHHGTRARRIVIVGERGTIVADVLNQDVRLMTENGEREIPLVSANSAGSVEANQNRANIESSRVASRARREGRVGANNTIRDMELHFIERVRNRGPSLNNALIGAETVAVLEMITKAVRRRKSNHQYSSPDLMHNLADPNQEAV